MIRVILVTTVGTNAPVMALASVESANAIRASLARTAIPYAQDTARAITTPATVTVNGKVITAKSPNVQMTALEMAYATAPFSLVSVTQDGAAMTAVYLTVQVNRIVTIEAHAQR